MNKSDLTYPVVCPDCTTERFVSYTTVRQIWCGAQVGRCVPCANLRLSERAAAERAARGVLAACRHCTKAQVNRPRGLCWGCYYTPGVKELYPSTSKYSRRGAGNFAGAAPLPPAPTTAAPGTPEKVAVMAARAEAGRAVFHPADARYEGDPLTTEFLTTQRATA